MKNAVILAVVVLFLTSAKKHPIITQRVDNQPLFDSINAYRQSKGISMLEYLPEEQASIDTFTARMIENFEHAKGPFYENIAFAQGYPHNRETFGFNQWKGSMRHNMNMLNRNHKYGTTSVYKFYGKYFYTFRGYTEKPESKHKKKAR